MFKKPTPTEQRILLPGVSWQQLEKLLVELGQTRSTRLTYDRGQLELMTPLEEHERCNRLIESLILVLADELSLKVRSLPSVLLKQPELECAIEPDACYDFTDAAWMSGITEINLTQALPPSLVVDIAITKPSLPKLPLYARLGIPEVWRYVTKAEQVLPGELLIYQLQGDRYLNCKASPTFGFLSADRVLLFLEHSDSMGLAKALIVLRDWVKERV